MGSRIFLGLVHSPVYNKHMETITTSVTNLDIHDIARCAITYGLERYYIIHPMPAQNKLVSEIIDYWQKGFGAAYNPNRKEALDLVRQQDSIAAVQQEISTGYPGRVITVVTDARTYPNTVSYTKLRAIIKETDDINLLLLFGTGWGMVREVMELADYVLEPVYGAGIYNHLSVRSAVAIILDRLLGEKWWE